MPAQSKTEPAAPQTLEQALLAAQMALPLVHKDATNSFHKYNYVSAEAMLTACREVLHAQGLMVRRTNVAQIVDANCLAAEFTSEDRGGTKTTTKMSFGTLVSTFELVHAPSGTKESFTVPWPIVPEKGRPVDKAMAGALTSSLSYFLRDLLMVPREEEGMDERNDTAYVPPLPPTLPPLKNAKPVPPIPAPVEIQPANQVFARRDMLAPEPQEDPALSPAPSKTRLKLLALMKTIDATPAEIERVAVMNGMVKEGTPFTALDDDCLKRFVSNWERVQTVIESKIRS